jgi:CHAD domain-containing protein
MAETGRVEVERKYEVGEAAGVPLLHELPGVARVEQPVEYELEAVYFDTAELVLAGNGVTLRRRTGGADEGWHLKLPAATGRLEIQRPLGGAVRRPPVQLVRLVRVHVRDHELVAVANLRTLRRVHRLLDADGAVLAEMCDDRVRATGPDGGDEQAWREWEFELVDGGEELLEAADRVLTEAGATPASGPSKLARTLGDRVPVKQKPDRKMSTIADVFGAYAGAQLDAIRQRDPDVRRDEPDAVHKMRVATRRLRSALATYRNLLDRERAQRLRDELKWLAGELSAARDSEVMRERLQELVASEPVELVMGPVARTVERDLGSKYRDGRVQALAALDSERYFRLLDDLEAFLENPPWTEEGKASKVLPVLLEHDWKRIRKAADHDLHEARKAAKRLRYAAESAVPVFGDRAKELAATAETIQEVLGVYQDSVVTRDLLRQLAVQVQLSGGNAFTYGRLHALEQARGEDAQRRFHETWQSLKPPKPKKW